MPIAFVQSLFAGKLTSDFSPSFAITGSKTVSLGNSIVVALGLSVTAPVTVTDNLGNSYSQIVGGSESGGNITARLYRAIVTNPGTLTTITISTSPTNARASGAIAVEFSGLGAALDSKAPATTAQSDRINAYPGGALANVAAYVANTLWIGAFAQYVGTGNTFGVEANSPSLPAVEPTVEQVAQSGTSQSTTGLLYYISGSPTASARLAGRFPPGSGYIMAAGAVFDVAGISNSDTCTGRIAFTGSVSDSWVKAIISSDVTSGRIPLTGSVSESWSKVIISSDVTSGRITVTGSVTENSQRGYYDSPTGRVNLGGTRTEGGQHSSSTSGRVTLAGATTESWHLTFNDLAIGLLPLDGASIDDWFVSTLYFDDPTGGVGIDGMCSDNTASFPGVWQAGFAYAGSWRWPAESRTGEVQEPKTGRML